MREPWLGVLTLNPRDPATGIASGDHWQPGSSRSKFGWLRTQSEPLDW